MIAALRTAYFWHRPLMILAALMLLCALVSGIGVIVDPRDILGAPAWAKPLKFSLSIFVYAATWAWLIAHTPRWQRLTRALGTAIAVTLAVEQVLIVWAAATGTTSHFNVSTGVHVVVWAAMAVAITVMYLCTFVASVAVFSLRLPSPSLTLAVRAGAVIALAGIGVAFLMTGPTEPQLTTPSGIVGAHAVGVADGGPGLPLLGWSTIAGDYRVAHFVGMHALQALLAFALVLRLVARRIPRLAAQTVQTRLVVAAVVAYAAAVMVLTVQAAAGQSVVRPDGVFLVAGWVIVAAFVVAVAGICLRGGGSASGRHPEPTPITVPA